MSDSDEMPDRDSRAVCGRAGLIAEALEHAADAVRVFRCGDGVVEVAYRNRSAADGRTVTEPELAEALMDPLGEVLRAGTCAESVHALRAWRFSMSDGNYVVAIERDATEHDRLERAYEGAVAESRSRRERTVRHFRNLVLAIASPDDGIAEYLECVMAELGMTTAVLAITSAAKTYRWTAYDKHAPRVPVPESLLAAARTAENIIRVVRHAPAEPAFVSTYVVSSGKTSLALCFALRDSALPLSECDTDFLILNAQLMAEMIPFAMQGAFRKATFAE